MLRETIPNTRLRVIFVLMYPNTLIPVLSCDHVRCVHLRDTKKQQVHETITTDAGELEGRVSIIMSVYLKTIGDLYF